MRGRSKAIPGLPMQLRNRLADPAVKDEFSAHSQRNGPGPKTTAFAAESMSAGCKATLLKIR